MPALSTRPPATSSTSSARFSGAFGKDYSKKVFDGDPAKWQGWTGRTNGYEASVDVLSSEELTFVFLSNLQSAANWQLREQIRNALAKQPVTPVPLPPPVAEQFEDPAAIVGRYGAAEVAMVDGRLFRGENEFHPIAGRRYYVPVSGTIMHFRRNAAGAVDALVSISGERETVVPRD